MRLWSLHPKYLDSKGLVALWREALLAQKVLQGQTRGYVNHPQLLRFRQQRHPVRAIANYLWFVSEEAQARHYQFDTSKIAFARSRAAIAVTDGQVWYEFEHLCRKLKQRDPMRYRQFALLQELDVHPMFYVQSGLVADWEKR